MKNLKYLSLLLLVVVLAFACHSRLRPNLFIVDGETSRKLNEDDCYYLNNFTLGTDIRTDPLTPGEGTVVITNRSIKDPDMKIIQTGLIKSYEQINYRLYIALPPEITVDSFDLKDRSLCRIIGLYEKEPAYKHFDCLDGFIVIDTVKNDRFFARMYGKYYNFENDSLIFDGAMNVKKRK